jgi:hypothetical protein
MGPIAKWVYRGVGGANADAAQSGPPIVTAEEHPRPTQLLWPVLSFRIWTSETAGAAEDQRGRARTSICSQSAHGGRWRWLSTNCRLAHNLTTERHKPCV